MKKIIATILLFLSSFVNASSVIVLNAEYDKEKQILNVMALVNKTENQAMYLLWGPCQETYPMRCFAKLSLTAKEDFENGDDSEYTSQTLQANVSDMAKPTYVVIRGDQNSHIEVFIGDTE